MGDLPQFRLQSDKDFRFELISSSPATAQYAYLKMERHRHCGAFYIPSPSLFPGSKKHSCFRDLVAID